MCKKLFNIFSRRTSNENAHEYLCAAPFTSFKIDTNKKVRPCGAWTGNYFGSIENQAINEIIESAEWIYLKNQMRGKNLPEGCMSCRLAEVNGGESLRNDFNRNAKEYLGNYSDRLIEIEIDSSNECNLACVHCSSDFSNKWAPFERQLKKDGFLSLRTRNNPDNFVVKEQILIQRFSEIKCSGLKILRLKGGEPFLNKELLNLLLYLKDKSLLSQIDVHIVTNGTVINKKFIDALTYSKSVHVSISIDGIDGLQQYIRYGSPSLNKIELFIDAIKHLPKIKIAPLTSIMAYNVFRLRELVLWWKGVMLKFVDVDISEPKLTHFVFWPQYLSVKVLPENVRLSLIAIYEQTDIADFSYVIHALKQPWLGTYWSKKFVLYTELMEKYRGGSIRELIPEISESMDLPPEINENPIISLMDELNFMIDHNCASAKTYFKRGLLKKELGDSKAAIEDFKTAMEMDNNLYSAIPEHWMEEC